MRNLSKYINTSNYSLYQSGGQFFLCSNKPMLIPIGGDKKIDAHKVYSFDAQGNVNRKEKTIVPKNIFKRNFKKVERLSKAA